MTKFVKLRLYVLLVPLLEKIKFSIQDFIMNIFDLEALLGKKMRVMLKDGTVYEGVCDSWTPSVDDPEDRENIDIEVSKNDLYTCYKDEIENIEFL